MRRALLMLLVLVPAATMAQGPVPILGDRNAAWLDHLHKHVRQDLPDFANADLQRYVTAVGVRLQPGKAGVDAPSFTVVDSPDPLSNVVPRRWVFLSAALFARLESEAELAALLAHQLGHVLDPPVDVRANRAAIPLRMLSAHGFCFRFTAESSRMPPHPYVPQREQDADLRAFAMLRAVGYDASALADVRLRTPTSAKLLPGEIKLVVANDALENGVVTNSTFDRLRAEVADTLRQRHPRRRPRFR